MGHDQVYYGHSKRSGNVGLHMREDDEWAQSYHQQWAMGYRQQWTAGYQDPLRDGWHDFDYRRHMRRGSPPGTPIGQAF
ncbi:hypothetical protein M406DRAFT_64745 [Cryphonectria parasitica EP155]|uniref:Uncharacterized protein n=1 Tax=Cryphonectria parasitica (strain ATCC 38755 / EP155) TaxID=660469 RepID=A0A9P4XVE4_CRYP1|nr:uncharacterized protein M406DRAFT_64745 [Cryphonectria parasitica EP155]KAF3761532.1 hypothetical protein M406DRAFT_64745 [Cryphonectria parasitica EP155]